MITIHYQPDLEQMARVASAFVESRPVIKIAVFLTNIAMILMFALASVLLLSGNLYLKDLSVIVFAILWFYFRHKLQIKIIKHRIAKRILNCSPWLYTIDAFQIKEKKYDINFALSWKHIRKIYIYHKLPGYLIPLPGLKQAGKFIWLPFFEFKGQDLDNFMNIVQTKRIKIINGK